MSEFILLPDIKKSVRMSGLQICLPETLGKEAQSIAAEANLRGQEITETDVIRTWIILGKECFGRKNSCIEYQAASEECAT